MIPNDAYVEINTLKVSPGQKVNLKDFSTDYRGDELKKSEGEELLEAGRKRLAEMQTRLYAHNRYGVLIILQAMDAAGKDGAVKHIMSGVNPMGVRITSFKAPSQEELDHDYLRRHSLVLPRRGEIAIHNRSHYENVLVTRVHPEYILKENIPGIDSVDKINQKFWKNRFKQIKRFEKNTARNGTIILKFFLHLSQEEQRKRLLSRIDDPSKNWKFDIGDLKERSHWNAYQHAYEEALSATSTAYAPWFIIPADNKWYTRLAIAAVIYRHLKELDIDYPAVTPEQHNALATARAELIGKS
jgi:PPK2 family polyphosphate:nucleotide phosphotransferase